MWLDNIKYSTVLVMAVLDSVGQDSLEKRAPNFRHGHGIDDADDETC